MRIRSLALAVALASLTMAPALAQTPRAPRPPAAPQAPPSPAAPAPPATPTPPAAPRREGQPVNIKLEVTITDQGRAGVPSLKKTITIVTGDGLNGRIRSIANYANIGVVPLNIDAEPELVADGKIRVRVNLQYSLPGNIGGGQNGELPIAGALRVTEIQENLSLIVENGKAIVAAQSADPVGDRQVTIEMKATVLR